MRPQTDYEKELEQELYGSRLLVLLECEGHFHQVALDNKQFKKVSDAVANAISPDPKNPGMEVAAIRMSRLAVPADALQGMRDFYTKAELEEMDRFDEEDFHNEQS